MSIVKLSDKLANMIAAGEVVERPLSVVKELVENAIDAEATKIDVVLKEAGMQGIKVMDNGVGMSKEDAIMAFERHATSKIKTEQDLFRIHSLGFRGEALPSIASVSKVSLETSDGTDGTRVEIHASKLVDLSHAVLRKGTAIEVGYLFYNTPARLKFIKNLRLEQSLVTDFLTKVSLMRPEISFSLTADDRVILQTSGDNQLLKTIKELYGNDTARHLRYVKGESYHFQIEGYTSSPVLSRSNRNYVTLLVNDRVVKHYGLNKKIFDLYKHKLPEGRFPVTIIRITADPLLIDVNVHPAKTEVKISDEYDLYNLIEETITNVLKEEVAIPEQRIFSNSFEQKEQDISSTEQSVSYDELVFDFSNEEVRETPHKPSFPELEYIGQFQLSYLLFSSPEALFIVDQHAAAERIRYEAYLHEFQKKDLIYQTLLSPLNFEFSPSEADEINLRLDELKQQGILLEPSGPHSYFVREVPTWFRQGLEQEYIDELIAEIVFNRKNLKEFELASLLACKRSIKANASVNEQEAYDLIRQLKECDHPYSCPHGRPTLIQYKKSEMEKFFGR